MVQISYVLKHVKRYWYLVSAEILNWYGSFCCSIVNILYNTLSIFFYQIKVFWESPMQNIGTQFSFPMSRKSYLFYLSYVATNYRGNIDRLNFNHCWVQICKLRQVSNYVLFNWFKLFLNSPLYSPLPRWHIKITHLCLYCEKVVYPGTIGIKAERLTSRT